MSAARARTAGTAPRGSERNPRGEKSRNSACSEEKKGSLTSVRYSQRIGFNNSFCINCLWWRAVWDDFRNWAQLG
jgi:hypothetical protein